MFLVMNVDERVRFLALYAHELTILARMHFKDGDWEAARQCNETVHRIVGYLGTALLNPDALVHESFIAMTTNGAQERGWGQILQQSLRSGRRQGMPE